MTDKSKTISIKSSVENLEGIRRFISGITRELGFREHAAFEVELALYEACANVIEHAYENESGNDIHIETAADAERLVITITDFGLPFKWDGRSEVNISEMIFTKQDGGLGLHIIEACIDDLKYERVNDKNILKLYKAIPKPENAA
jgi:serine/threonine-protein kinase RsbW